uniref:Uncharacterized protein n=1 Tax=Anguilla anguilla TaxID=7936 RepID=A0A0E9UB74_ANGAN
MLQQCLVLVF